MERLVFIMKATIAVEITKVWRVSSSVAKVNHLYNNVVGKTNFQCIVKSIWKARIPVVISLKLTKKRKSVFHEERNGEKINT